MIKPQHILRRPKRWLRRTTWVLSEMQADFGFARGRRPVWLRDNPFLLKMERTDARGLGLSLRLAVTVALLGGFLLGGLYLEQKYSSQMAIVTNFIFRSSFPVLLFVVLSFVHVLLIVNARTTSAVALADEARRATLPDLLLSPLRRGEMLLAMGVGPARAAGLLALAGLPVYVLLGQFGGLTAWEIVCVYILYALLCFQPPVYAVPALSGLAATPESPAGQFAAVPNRRSARRAGYFGVGFPVSLAVLFASGTLGALGAGWLPHLFTALNLTLMSGFSFLIFFSWPYYAMQLLSDRLPFFHLTVSPLWYVLPLMVMVWGGSALQTASALSAGDLAEMRRLPIWTRAQTLSRTTLRLAGFCALAVVWKAWVESGDTAGLANQFATGTRLDAAGLLLLLGGFSLPNVCGRALAILPRFAGAPQYRAAPRVLRRALKRALRPLVVALGMFGLACALGGLSPFAVPVYESAGKILLVGVSTVFWAVGVRRALPGAGKWITAGLLYVLPVVALGIPGLRFGASLSPVSAWVSLFAGGPALLARIQFPQWHLEALPSFWVCALVPSAVGMVLMTVAHRRAPSVSVVPEAVKAVPVKRGPTRNEARTAALMGWIARRTDNPLFLYEMRTRTRSGRWFDWVLITPVAFAGVLAVTAAYPILIELLFDTLSPFRFFNNGRGSGGPGFGWIELASLLLAAQCYALVFRGQIIGEQLISKDRQQGTWGFVLLTPLSVRQIFWGKVFGQTATVGLIWAAASLAEVLLYALAAPSVAANPFIGLRDEFWAWGSGQLFVASLLILGVGLGASLATFPKIQKTLKGLSTLLFVAIIGLSIYVEIKLFPDGFSFGYRWCLMRYLAGNAVYALALSAPLFVFAEWRFARLRGRDIAAGDGMG